MRSVQATAGLQRVAEDEGGPLHLAPEVVIPPAMARVVLLLRLPHLLPAAHDRRHLRPAPLVPARRRLVYLLDLNIVRLGHGQRDVREVVQLLEAWARTAVPSFC